MSDIFGGMFDEFSVAYVEMLEAKSCLWKRAAKKWRSLALLASLSWKTIIKQRDDAQADADRRRELLRDIADWYEGKEYSMSDDLWKRVAKELTDV